MTFFENHVFLLETRISGKNGFIILGPSTTFFTNIQEDKIKIKHSKESVCKIILKYCSR